MGSTRGPSVFIPGQHLQHGKYTRTICFYPRTSTTWEVHADQDLFLSQDIYNMGNTRGKKKRKKFLRKFFLSQDIYNMGSTRGPTATCTRGNSRTTCFGTETGGAIHGRRVSGRTTCFGAIHGRIFVHWFPASYADQLLQNADQFTDHFYRPVTDQTQIRYRARPPEGPNMNLALFSAS